MSSPPPAERFKAEMPKIPGVDAPAGRRPGLLAGVNPRAALGAGIALVVLLGFFAGRSLLRPRHPDPAPAEAAPQIVIPTPESETRPAPPIATESHPEIATLAELAEPWSSKEFYFRNAVSGAAVPALIVRLPGGAASQGSSYWAFSLDAPFGRCQLEYIVDLNKLSGEYGFRAKHPMAGNPCSRSVFDPLRLKDLPGNIWVRGAVVQGSDLRPPYGIEVNVAGNQIQALRME